jgi:hypothetical protein
MALFPLHPYSFNSRQNVYLRHTELPPQHEKKLWPFSSLARVPEEIPKAVNQPATIGPRPLVKLLPNMDKRFMVPQ